MPIPVKPCEGRFSEDVLSQLGNDRGRSQWAVYTCEACGAKVGAVLDKGKWSPEQHWPSVKYPARNVSDKKHEYSRFSAAPEFRAETTSR